MQHEVQPKEAAIALTHPLVSLQDYSCMTHPSVSLQGPHVTQTGPQSDESALDLDPHFDAGPQPDAGPSYSLMTQAT
jgi:hypothetical protein